VVREIGMEQKLIDLKEEFCEWYCPNRDETIKMECSGIVGCNQCDAVISCEEADNIFIDLCDYCMVDEYIRFIRDEL